MQTNSEDSKLSIVSFILFALVFLIISASICFLWSLASKPEQSLTDPNKPLMSTLGSPIYPTVIIDAGHGGADGGAVGLSAVSEKQLNLDIALSLRDMLTSAGIKTVMTRETDIMLTSEGGGTNKNQDLRARRQIVENTPNPIFISIHMNSFSAEKYSGLQVYYSKNDPKSRILAEKIQSDVRTYIQNDNDREIKKATDSIYLLENLTCPAVLIECGFLTNSEECSKLNTKEYRNELAFVIFGSVCNYICANGS